MKTRIKHISEIIPRAMRQPEDEALIEYLDRFVINLCRMTYWETKMEFSEAKTSNAPLEAERGDIGESN